MSKPLGSMNEQPITEMVAEFEKRSAIYQAEISRLKEENYRLKKLLNAAHKPETRIYRSDFQALLGSKEEVHSEERERSPSPAEESDIPIICIKEEEDNIFTCQEGVYVPKEEDASITFPIIPLPVKSEKDEEKPHSQRHQSKTEKNRGRASRKHLD